MTPKIFLVTGGCGFIGTSLIASLLRKQPDANIRILDNFATGTPEDLGRVCTYALSTPEQCISKEGIVLIKGDVRDPETTLLCVHGSDYIVHLAANTGVGPSVENPREDMECNVIGTLNMLEAARVSGVKMFIFASSGAPAGEVELPIHEELPPHPVSPYAASKLAGEGYCSAYYRTFGIDTVCLRFGNVYGPGSKRKSSVVAKFISQALKGESCEIFGDGTQTRDFIYIDDLIQAVLLSIKNDVGGEIFQIATGRECTVKEVARVIARSLEQQRNTMTIIHGASRRGDVHRNYSDTKKSENMLGWKADTSFEWGIDQTVRYFVEETMTYD